MYSQDKEQEKVSVAMSILHMDRHAVSPDTRKAAEKVILDYLNPPTICGCDSNY
jgi:hypothetical protein